MAGGAPLVPTDLGKRHGLQPAGELPQVTIEQVKKRLKDRYFAKQLTMFQVQLLRYYCISC